jgi:hypothetical protein
LNVGTRVLRASPILAADVVGVGGLVAVSHRTDYLELQGWLAAQAALELDGSWELVSRSEPLPYLPGNDYYATHTLTHFVYRVRAQLT